MAWIKGFNFRQTAGYVTDNADETYVRTPSDGETYPTTRNGVTFGWDLATVESRNRSTGVDVRLAGVNFDAVTTGAVFQVDLSQTGPHTIRAAFGEATYARTINMSLQDNTTTFSTISGSPASGHFLDATGTDYAAASWPGSNTSINRTFTSSILRVLINATVSPIAHLQVMLAAAGAPPPFHRSARFMRR